MAEYIDKMSILDTTICEGIACEECAFSIEDGSCSLRGRVLALLTADVVERSKIDKAIEEIEEQRYIHYTNVSDVIDIVLKILKEI